MKTPLTLTALCAGALLLAGCDKTTPKPPEPRIDQAGPGFGTTAETTTNPQVPPAETVFPAGSTQPQATRTDGLRRPALEAPANTPLPGQNNDHSAPLSSGQ